jgi:hypothetical protein
VKLCHSQEATRVRNPRLLEGHIVQQGEVIVDVRRKAERRKNLTVRLPRDYVVDYEPGERRTP